MLNEFKRCQFCNESVSQGASKCRYCYEWISDKPKNEQISIQKPVIKISHAKKQIIALVVFSVVFTGGLFVFGAKAFKAIIDQPIAKTCDFNSIRTSDGYIFRFLDDPDKKDSDAYITRDKVNCKYYLGEGSEKIEITTDIAQSLVNDLENSSQNNSKLIQFPGGESRKIHVSVDVVSDNPQIKEKLIDIASNLKPGNILTLQVYGGNSENTLSQKKLNINYTSVEYEMYKKTFERQRETVVYVKEKKTKREKLDMDAVISNDKQYIIHNILEFYGTFKNENAYNQTKFLFPYLKYLLDNLEEGAEYRFITEGSFNRIDQKYYNFDEKHFSYHSRRIIERLKAIEDIKSLQADNQESETMPEKLPPFHTYFDTRFKNIANKFENLCFDIVQSEADRNINWMSEKSKLYKGRECKK